MTDNISCDLKDEVKSLNELTKEERKSEAGATTSSNITDKTPDNTIRKAVINSSNGLRDNNVITSKDSSELRESKIGSEQETIFQFKDSYGHQFFAALAGKSLVCQLLVLLPWFYEALCT